MTLPQQPTRAPARATINITSLREQRQEMISQLEEVTDRRGDLAQERMNAQARGDQALVREYDAQVAQLGERMARLERQKLQLDDAIADALASGNAVEARAAVRTGPVPAPGFPSPVPPGAYVSVAGGGRQSPSLLGDQYKPILAAQSLGILLLAFFVWRLTRRKPSPAVGDATAIGQLQQSVDAIAIEVERISENQRYVTKVLNDRSLGEGQQPAESVRRQAERVERR